MNSEIIERINALGRELRTNPKVQALDYINEDDLAEIVEALEHKDKYKWHRTEASGDKPEGLPFLSIIGDLGNKPRATHSVLTIGTKNGHEYMFDWDELKEWGFVVERFDMPLEEVKVPSAFGRQVVSKLKEHRILAWKEVEEFNEQSTAKKAKARSL